MPALFHLLATASAVAVSPTAISVPINLVVLSDGVRRYSVTLTVDGQPLVAGLDTGSTGLRILPGGLTDHARSLRGEPTAYHYGSGVAFTGRAIRLPVAFGTSPARDIVVDRVDSISCTERNPECAARRQAISHYRVQGDGLAGEGFNAILGIGLARDAVANPLQESGVRHWIIELPRTAGETGHLVIDPDPLTMARYRLIATEGSGNQVSACIAAAGSKALCAPAMLDTGANGLRILGGKESDILADGTAAVIRLGRASDAPAMSVTIGRRDEASAMRLYPARVGGDRTINLGIAPFLRWSVLYKADRDEIGLADR